MSIARMSYAYLTFATHPCTCYDPASCITSGLRDAYTFLSYLLFIDCDDISGKGVNNDMFLAPWI